MSDNEIQSARILIVEDEAPIRTLISFACAGAGFEVECTDSAVTAQRIVEENRPDLVLLDYMLPELSGVEWLEKLHADPKTKDLPVIMLTARGSESDRVKGLNAGADDYVVKPFMPRELIARIQAVLRRYRFQSQNKGDADNLIVCGPLTMNESSFEAKVDDVTLSLSAKEFKLLLVFAKNPERVYSREMLLQLVWDNAYVDERTVDVHMLRLRKQLQGTKAENLLQTVRGLGYRAHVE
ncbi:MAG: response regulator [Candidatus Aphodousia sp.]|nr:response regulator [Sutterella sp.]MDY2900018.1 response regulator [Candidatus Aphodousia sp.]